jgi:hypothetical protein
MSTSVVALITLIIVITTNSNFFVSRAVRNPTCCDIIGMRCAESYTVLLAILLTLAYCRFGKTV